MNKELRHSKEGLPPSLLSMYQWIETGRGDNPKAPKSAAWNQRKNWKQYAGVAGCMFPGFCLTRGLVCFDFDSIDNGSGKLSRATAEFVARMCGKMGAPYIEKSCSRRGRHALYTLPDAPDLDALAGQKIDVPLEGDAHVEVWIGGPIIRDSKKTADSNRQIAMTGWKTRGSAPDVTTAPDVSFLLELKTESDARKERENQHQQQEAPRVHQAKELPPPDLDAAPVLSVDAIPDVIRRSKSGDLFKRLFDDGDTTGYPSRSEAHLALMNMLPFYTKGDKDKMIAVFKLSALARDMGAHGDRADYLERTAQKALDTWDGEIYIGQTGGRTPTMARDKTDAHPQQGAPVTAWPDVDAKGRPVVTEANVQALLDSLGVSLRSNEMTKTIEFYGSTFAGIPNDGDRTKNCITKLRGEAAKKGLRMQRQDLIDALDLIASRHKYHPARNFLKKAREEYGDSTADYIKQSFDCFILDSESAARRDLCLSMYTHFLVAAARAPFNSLQKNESYQGILILVGPQHIGKTRFLEYLVPSPDMRCTGVKVNPNNRDDLWKASKFWGVELGEFGTSMSAKRVEDMKNWVTASKDVFRKPYAAGFSDFPRQSFYYGSTNQQRFLCDETGDRRYWPITLKGFDFTNFPPANLLWGQVMTLAFADGDDTHSSRKAGRVTWWLSDEELDEMTQMQEAHKVESEEEAALKDMLDWDAQEMFWQEITATELAAMLSNRMHCGRLSAVRIGKSLTRMSLTDHRIKRRRSKKARTYTVPPIKDMDAQAADAFEDSSMFPSFDAHPQGRWGDGCDRREKSSVIP